MELTLGQKIDMRPTNALTKTPLVYILAASHSGSTLLAMLLGGHPDVCTVGELKVTSLGDIDRYRCSCLSLIKQCPFWSGIRQDMAGRGFLFDFDNTGTHFGDVASRYVRWLLRPLHRRPLLEKVRDAALLLSPIWRARLPQIQAQNAALVECACRRAGKQIIVDSSKMGLRLKYLLRNPALDVKVVRLIRDGRAVALTYTDPANFADANSPNFRGGGMGGDRETERLTLAEAAREWRRSNEEAELIVRRLARSRWLEVRYEDLCRQTDQMLRKIFAFLGVSSEEYGTDFRAVEQHVIGNGMRLDSTAEVQLDERWRTVLNASELDVFDSVAGVMNRRLGYQ